MATDLLLLAAHAPEFEGLQAALGDGLRGQLGGLSVACRSVGVGLSAAGAGTARALLTESPAAALLLGSVGAYPNRPQAAAPLSLCVPTTAHLVDAAAALGKAALPAPMEPPVHANGPLCDGLRGVTGAAAVALANTLGITTDDALASALTAERDCHVENLEAHAVLLACQTAGIPAAALLVTTNTVGNQGRAQWLQHREAAARHGTAALLRWLAAGAPGLRPAC